MVDIVWLVARPGTVWVMVEEVLPGVGPFPPVKVCVCVCEREGGRGVAISMCEGGRGDCE